MRPQGMSRENSRGRGGGTRGRGTRGGTRGRGGRGGMGIEKFAFGKTSTYQKHDATSEARKHKRAVVTKYKRMLRAEESKAGAVGSGNGTDIGDEDVSTEIKQSDSDAEEVDDGADGSDDNNNTDDEEETSRPAAHKARDNTKRKKKSDPYAKQRAIAEANRAARAAAQKRKDEEIKMAEMKKDQSNRMRKNRTKKLQARTPKGQPVLRNQMKDILKTLNREKYSTKKSK